MERNRSCEGAASDDHSDSPEINSKSKPKGRGRKRKRRGSNSSSGSDVLPDNAFEVEKNVIASAVRNNLDEVSVKKILKKVVTNDHVLALVKLREEEEESSTEESALCPKLTRAKVKELMKVSPKTAAPWNLENLELTPIKHIPVKTRPEVKALIAQELQEDEDDEEYKPSQDEVPSDDDQGLESCSDLDSQPRTPATPGSQHRTSPKMASDGPFKIPQDVSTPTRRKLEMEEGKATIALRTRSKLSLSETPIEHIESSFIPPDDLPMPVDDHLWNDFLNECLNPASVSRNEDDDEADPEYNVAADPDAHDEDEEALESSIIKISKKELNDLVTELFSIIPESTVEDALTNMANSVLTDTSHNESSSRWEGKQEPLSDEEKPTKMADRLVFERNSTTRLSVGKSEPEDSKLNEQTEVTPVAEPKDKKEPERRLQIKTPSNVVNISVQERTICIQPASDGAAPPALLQSLVPEISTSRMKITIKKKIDILPEQVLILQQQLRMHIQIATSNFLQLFVNPLHWTFAPIYKEYLKTLFNMAEAYPKSVANVCNLKPAMELVETWEKTVSEDTPDNKNMVEFIQREAERWRRRSSNNSFYVGEFHETFKNVIANSPVFLYPHLLPAMPFRADSLRRFGYLRSEDELLVLGLEQFWTYVENNPLIYRAPNRFPNNYRWGLTNTVDLIHKHMLPFIPARHIKQHIQLMRRSKDKDNPIRKFFMSWKVDPVKHKLVAYNPKLSLFEQPEHEIPRIWIRHLAKTSKRFRAYIYQRTKDISRPESVDVDIGLPGQAPTKEPLPIHYLNVPDKHYMPVIKPILGDKFDIAINKTKEPSQAPSSNFFRLIITTTGACLVPWTVINTNTQDTINNISHNEMQTNTVNCNVAPISSAIETKSPETKEMIETNKVNVKEDPDHCTCCILLRKIRKLKQTFITDFFGSKSVKKNTCGCKEKRYPKISNRLRLLLARFNSYKQCIYSDIKKKIKLLNCTEDEEKRLSFNPITHTDSMDDLEIVISFQMKLTHRMGVARNVQKRKKIDSLITRFNPIHGDPITLAHEFEKVFDTDCVDMYKEFLAFLTPEQAEKIDNFRDYFTQNCVKDLVKKVEEQVMDKETQLKILCIIQKWFTGVKVTACAMCCQLLVHMDKYPSLAEYTFSLFPHLGRKLVPPSQNTKSAEIEEQLPEPAVVSMEEQVTENGEPRTAADYEADHSDSGEETEEEDIVDPLEETKAQESVFKIKVETPEITSQAEEDSDSSAMSMMIMSEDESFKSEPAEWRRDEDKLILELLKQYLSPEERKDKTILEIIEEKNILPLLFESLTNKSVDDIRERVLYLLKLLGG